MKSFAIAIVVVITGFSLSGCGGGISSKFGKEYGSASPYYRGSGPVPKGGGRYKVGNPYTVNGKTYYPKEDRNYDKVGSASWYGPTFHRRKTANGEYFDMNRLTAAHPTLPLPSFVRVTNLENDKSVIVRVNDRGPYAHKRLIDLSKKTATVLGFIGRGTARVRVQYVSRAPLNGDDYYSHTASKKPTASEDSKRVISSASFRTRSNVQNVRGEKLYVQAASFSSVRNARRLQHKLAPLGQEHVVPAHFSGQTRYRVRMGPMSNNREAKVALRRIVEAGHSGATLIIE